MAATAQLRHLPCLAGFVLGMFGAATSLVFNVVGSLSSWAAAPARAYPRLPDLSAGAAALKLSGPPTVDDDLTWPLAAACTSAPAWCSASFPDRSDPWLPGASFPPASLWQRAGTGAVADQYYGLLAWLQPLLFGGNWIVGRSRAG